jgi:glycosyltransferase involved in cell wall biosynthesis
MRIVMLSQFYPPVIGGEERHVITLSESLAMRGHEVTVISLAHPERAPEVESRGVTVLSVNGSMQRVDAIFSESARRHAPPFPDPELGYKLAAMMRTLKPDVVHGHNWLSRSFVPVKQFTNAGFVVTLHDYSLACAVKNMMRRGVPCDGPGLGRCISCSADHYGNMVGPVTCVGNWATGAFERRTVDRYIAVSRAVAKQCGLEARNTPYEVLPTFISDDVGVLSDAPDSRVDQLPPNGFLLFVGDLNRKKGIEVLLDAYRSLVGAPPLVLIGRRCPDTPRELPENVTLFESWPHHAVMRAWSRCLFGIAPSVWAEACGTIVMEANAVGKTMIATRTGGLADLVESGKTGLLVPPGDAGALAAAMRTLIADPDLREDMAAASRAHVERFMAKSIVPRIERIYDEVSSRSAPRMSKRAKPMLAGGPV